MGRKAIDITGQKFHKLTAIEFNHIKNNMHFWLFKCDCGKSIIAYKSDVLFGNKKSCGCDNIKRKDIAGKKFNKLTAIKFSHMDENYCQFWLFKCDCGNEKIIKMRNVELGTTVSCTCHIRKLTTKHGYTNNPVFNIWKKIKARCHDSNDQAYAYYGGRGLSMSEEWKDSFDTFVRDMGVRPSKNHSIDRIDNDIGYSKENCKWSTKHEQQMNRRNTIYVDYNGEKVKLFELCEKINVDYVRTFKRIMYYGWDIEKSITTPPKKN